MSEYVTLHQLAEEFGIDRSNCRRWILKKGFEPARIRTRASAHQLTLALSPEDAQRARQLRRAEGFGEALGLPVQVVDCSSFVEHL